MLAICGVKASVVIVSDDFKDLSNGLNIHHLTEVVILTSIKI